MANPVGSSANTHSNQQEMSFDSNENNSNHLGIQNLANNYEEIRTRKKIKNKKNGHLQFKVTDVQGK